MNSKLYKFVMCMCTLLIGAYACAYAQAPGQSCATAIPMSEDFSVQITSPQTVWYSAWTFDLPLAVAFVPTNGEADPAPEVEMDFSCTSGYYEDSILCSLFCRTSGGSGIQFDLPYKQALTKGTKDGQFAYTLALGERYRDLLLRVGISYNVKVLVKVKYNSTGVLSMAPDAFNNCMDGPKFMQFGDTVLVAANDLDRHVIVPYVQWQEDTVIYKWDGTAPCTMAVANTCDFDPNDALDENIIQRTANPIQPGDSLKVSATAIYDWVHNPLYPNQAGMYFAKFYSSVSGVMTITKAPQAVPDGDATLLRYGKTYALDANSTAIFAIPDSWKNDVQFSAPTEHLFSLEISNSSTFTTVLKSYSFDRKDSGRWKGVTGSDLQACWNQVASGNHYLYIRFICSEATTVTPERWAVSECFTKTANYLITPGTTKNIARSSATSIPQTYRFIYADWAGGDMTITFDPTTNCEVYLADTCGMNRNNANAPYWLLYKKAVNRNNPLVIKADTIAQWADRIDEEGSFYAIFYTTATGTNRNLTFTTDKEAETDPVYPHTTVSITCDESGNATVSVSENQHIILTNEAGVKQDEWDAVVGTPHPLNNLPAGEYTLRGEKDEIKINL